MKCPNCGAESSGKICEYCGTDIKSYKQNNTQKTHDVNATDSQGISNLVQADNKNIYRVVWLAIIIFVVVIPFIVVAIVINAKGNRESKINVLSSSAGVTNNVDVASET